MALGYEIGTIMKRTSTLMSDGAVSVKLDNIEGMTHQFIQVGAAMLCTACHTSYFHSQLARTLAAWSEAARCRACSRVVPQAVVVYACGSSHICRRDRQRMSSRP